MEVFEGHRALFRPLSRPSITIGNFDGVHLGHQQLLKATRLSAARLRGDAVVMTFDPHPTRFLAPANEPPPLSSQERKQELLEDFGINVALREPFDQYFSAISAGDFTKIVLHETLGAKHIVVGDDFGYGSDRSGSIDSLRAAGQQFHFGVEVIDAVEINDTRASSTAIRQALIDGKLDLANRLLGRPYDVDGPVVRGAGRGRQLGIPTANVAPQAVLLPQPGIYATQIEILDSGERYMAATSLGTNPTFVTTGTLTLEPHLLDFDGDLYNRYLRVFFVEQIRHEMRFDSKDALLAQIHNDIAITRKILQ